MTDELTELRAENSELRASLREYVGRQEALIMALTEGMRQEKRLEYLNEDPVFVRARKVLNSG